MEESIIQKFGHIVLGSILVSIGVNGFLVPHQLLDGGVMGVSLILYYFFSIPTGTSMVLFSVPLYLFAFIFYRHYFYKSILGMIVSTVFLNLFAFLSDRIQTPVLIGAIIGGTLIGIGIGLILQAGVTSDGLDLCAQMVGTVSKMNVGVIIFILDSVILLLGMKFFGLHTFVYSLLAVTIVGCFTSVLTLRYIK